MRTIHDLVNVDTPAWSEVRGWIAAAKNGVEVLPADMARRAEALVATQVTVASAMGAIVYETGGMLVDQGWLRVLGSGHPRLARTLAGWNVGRSTNAAGERLGFWLVADDVVGGFFALDGGALGPGKAEMYYFAPDALRWESMGAMGYSAFILWTLGGDLAKFYENLRWPGWEAEVRGVGGNEGLSIAPPLWTREGKDIARASRAAISIAELYELNVVELPRQLGA